MSGGVDSTASALILRQHHHVKGFFMRLAQPDFTTQKERVEEIAAKLEIDLQIVDLRQQFNTLVLKYFSNSYYHGLTPNPCVVCNREIKFGLFFKAVRENGAEYMATGHYAQIVENKGYFSLHCGIDARKDQSYFLSRLDHTQLAKIIFPLGAMNKENCYNYVREQGFYDFDGLESQDVCFLEKRGIGHFLDKGMAPSQAGPIMKNDGTILGQHQGLYHYTIGQRKGLGISSDSPLYVIELDIKNNCLVVGKNDELFCDTMYVHDLHWLAGKPPYLSRNYSVRIRYSHRGSEAHINLLDKNRAKIIFSSPQRAITPGQFAVIYDGTELLGSGIIEKSNLNFTVNK